MENNNIRLEMPTGWDGVTIAQWQELNQLAAEDYDNDVKLLIDQLSVLLDADSDVVRRLPLETVTEMGRVIAGFDDAQLQGHRGSIEVGGVERRIVPDLKDLTFGEWVDLDGLVKEPVANMHRIVSVLYRPVAETRRDGSYRLEEYDSDESGRAAAVIRDSVTIDCVYGVLVFFYAIENEFTGALQTYLGQMARTGTRKSWARRRPRTGRDD